MARDYESLTHEFLNKHNISVDENLFNRFNVKGTEPSKVFFDTNQRFSRHKISSHEWFFHPENPNNIVFVSSKAGESPYYDYLHDLVKYSDENVKDNNYFEFLKDKLLFGNNIQELNAFKQTDLYKKYATSMFERYGVSEHQNPSRYHDLFFKLLDNPYEENNLMTINSNGIAYDGRHRINIMKFFDDLHEKYTSGKPLYGFEAFLYKEFLKNHPTGRFPDNLPMLLVDNLRPETIPLNEWVQRAKRNSSKFSKNSLEDWTMSQNFDEKGNRIIPRDSASRLGNFPFRPTNNNRSEL
jgi:hypothetical protein